mgnify:CR=1 FL=1
MIWRYVSSKTNINFRILFKMYAIFEHKDKQYKVSVGDTLKLPRQNALKKGDTLKFENILFLKNENGDIQIGSPNLKGCAVEAKVLEQIRDKKIIVFKKKRRHNYRRKNGHRQDLTLVKINGISSSNKQKKDPVTDKKKEIVKEEKDGS